MLCNDFFFNYSVLFMYRDWAVIVQSLKGHDCLGTEEPSCCHILYVLLNQLGELIMIIKSNSYECLLYVRHGTKYFSHNHSLNTKYVTFYRLGN